MKLNQKSLAVLLSKLKTFETPEIKLEQYQTDSEIAAKILWYIYLNNELQNKTIADFGCGNGIFGLASLILGAKKVYFIDIDKTAVKTARENLKLIEKALNKKLNSKAEFLAQDIKNFNKQADLVIQNPPFGIKSEPHKDKKFLIKAMSTAPLIYSIHKIESKKFIQALSAANSFKLTAVLPLKFPIKKFFLFHKKRIHFINVACFKLQKSK